jgi:hypothetical protein
MPVPFKFRSVSALVAVVAATGLLAACGGSDNDGPPAASISGMAAVGAPLAGAQIALTCADGTTLTATTRADGSYTTNVASFRLPCIGQATKAPVTYRGLLFSGVTANFTPLTDILAEVVLAAAAPGSRSLTITEFLAKIRNDATFAANVSSPTVVDGYRGAVVEVVRERLIAAGLDPKLADILLTSDFESAPFLANGTDPLDKVLDDIAPVLQGPDGNVLSDVKTDAKLDGDALPTPPSTATGGTGGVGGTGATGN